MNIRAAIQAPQIDPDVEAFAHELSELCRKFGLGITGTPIAFIMERDDFLHEYKVDEQSRLILA
jgi:hypothetical protein